MRTQHSDNPHRPSRTELGAMDAFIESVRAGRRPHLERYLKQYPQFAETLRPVLAGMVLLDAEYRRFQEDHPGVDVEELFGVPKSQ